MSLGGYTKKMTLDELKNKYQSALQTIQDKGVVLSHINMEAATNCLSRVPRRPKRSRTKFGTKSKRWTQALADLNLRLSVDTSLPQPQAAAAAAGAAGRTYTVKAGDTLSKIAKEFYGNANEYNKIFEANKDQLTSPDRINVGQELNIP